MNTLGKILDTIMAKRIQYIAEKHIMLPQTHTGGRKLTSCEHAIHLVLEKVNTAWRNRKVASLLLLDVSGAFDNVSHIRLLHNLRKRGLPLEVVRWIKTARHRSSWRKGLAALLISVRASRKARHCHRPYISSIMPTCLRSAGHETW